MGRGPHRRRLLAARQGRLVTASAWQAARYPLTTVCSLCGRTLTIRLDGDGPTTVTHGHAHDCVQNPARTRRQGSAA